MISVSSVYKNYGHTTALYNVSFKAKEGEIIGFLGPNGAGKTTTMRLILGILKPTVGTITVDADNPLFNRVAVVKKIGYLAENNPLYLEMKVGEYLEFIRSVKGASTLGTIPKDIGIDEVMGRRIEELSRGFRQRVGLGAALIGDPKILILDEPTSGLDPLEQDKIRKLIIKIARKKTIIFSTHVLSEVEDIANRLIILHLGKIVFDGKKPKGKGRVEKLFKKLVS